MLLAAALDRLREPTLRVLDQHFAHRAELAGAHALCGFDDERVRAVRMRQAIEAAARFQRVAQLEAFGERRGRGLVREHVKAVPECGRRDGQMQIVRRDDCDELHPLVCRQLRLGREHRVEVGVAALRRKAQARAAPAAPFGVARKGAADERHGVVEARGGAVHGADERAFAAADHAESHLSHRGDSSLGRPALDWTGRFTEL